MPKGACLGNNTHVPGAVLYRARIIVVPQEAAQDALGVVVLARQPGGDRILKHTAMDLFEVKK